MIFNSKLIDKPIRSAEAVAAMRAASAKEHDRAIVNPDCLARYYVTGFYTLLIMLPHALLRRLIEFLWPGSYSYFLARTKYIDFHFLGAIENGIKQIVILGAGYDTRAARFLDQMHNVSIFEIDLPSTQQKKLRLIEGVSVLNNPDVIYIQCDFNDSSLNSLLQDHGIDSKQPTFFIWEGVSYYLKEDAVRNVFRLVAENFAKGSSIAFDYSLKSFVNGSNETYGAKKVRKWLVRNRESFFFGLNEGELDTFLSPLGMRVMEDIGPNEISKQYLQRKNGSSVGKPLGHLRLAYASTI